MSHAVEFASALLMVGGFGLSIYQLFVVYRADPGTSRATPRWVGWYGVYCVAGIGSVALWLDGPKPEHVAIGMTAFLLAWTFYGAVRLVRLVPRTAPLPAWITRAPGVSEAVLANAAVLGLSTLLW